jgi:hypothetical protein
LRVDQMEVDGMGVAGEIHDLPDLDGSGRWSLGSWIYITQSPSRQVLVVQALGGERSDRLDQATVIVEVLIQREQPISHTVEREGWLGWVTVIEEQSRLISSQEVALELSVDLR